jgi:hypothetical protein
MMTSVLTLLAWLLVPLTEWGLSQSAMVTPTIKQVVLEFTAFGILGVCQLVLVKTPNSIWRSPLWPGVVVIAGTALVVGPAPLMQRFLYMVAVLVVSFVFVRLGSGRRFTHWLAIPWAIFGAIVARYFVLALASQISSAQMGDSITVANPFDRLQTEVVNLIPRGTSAAGDGPPLILLTVDTLRADEAVTMKSYARLSRLGRAWPKASAVSSWTLPSMASIHTGVLPAEHGADGRPGGHYQGLSTSVETLAEALSGAGYRTNAVVTNPWLESPMGFARGFDSYTHATESMPHRFIFAGMADGPSPIDAEAVVSRALEVLESTSGPGTFLWVHLLDPHMPYMHADGGAGDGLADGQLRSGKLTTATMRQEIRAAYNAEVAHMDAQIMRLIDGLEENDFFTDGLLVFVADHGEEFWDHGGTEHGHSHHTEVVDVAMTISGPTVSSSGSGVVSHVDVLPTLLKAAGIERRGIDLRQGAPSDRITLTYGNNYYRIDRSARDSTGRVIIYGEPTQRVSADFFDHVNDPNELQPLPLPLESGLYAAALALEAPEEAEAAAINRAALEALGYIQ